MTPASISITGLSALGLRIAAGLALLAVAIASAGCGGRERDARPPQAEATPTPQESSFLGRIPTREVKSNLSPDDQQLLAQARARGETEVMLLIAAEPGAAQAVAEAVARIGGDVRQRDDDVGYFRALVPADKVEEVAQLEGIEAVELDQVIPIEDPKP